VGLREAKAELNHRDTETQEVLNFNPTHLLIRVLRRGIKSKVRINRWIKNGDKNGVRG
jgi:hypothetical protein